MRSWVQAESKRVGKTLAYQRAYDAVATVP